MNTAIEPMAQIESLCARLASESETLAADVAALQADLEEVKRKHLVTLKRSARLVATLEAQLHAAVEACPDKFRKPRTLILHGIKVGYTVAKGKLEFADEQAVVAAIKRHWKSDADLLIKTTESPRKDALRELPATDLAKIGCSIVGAGEATVVKRLDGDVEVLINSLKDKFVEAMLSPG
jgi:hypothetical protein